MISFQFLSRVDGTDPVLKSHPFVLMLFPSHSSLLRLLSVIFHLLVSAFISVVMMDGAGGSMMMVMMMSPVVLRRGRDLWVTERSKVS